MKILKQRNFPPFLGMAKLVIGQVTPYIGWVNLALVGVMSFYTTFNPLFLGIGMNVSIWVFIAVIVLIMAILTVFEWVFMFPSFYAANNRQWWEHDNPMRDKMEELEAKIDKLLKEKDIQ